MHNTKTMKAAIVHQFGTPLKIEEIPLPEVTPGKILIKIIASGVCHTDLHAIEGDWPVKPVLPLIPGHEGAGIVAAVGKNVTAIKEGDRVGVPWLHTACGHCTFCLTGWETLCEAQLNTGYSVNGCFAEYVLADPQYVGHIPPQLDFAPAASILCAGVTVYKGIKETNTKPGDWIVIWGIGGLGHLAIQYAKAMGLHVVAIDIHEAQLKLAHDLKADIVINSASEDAVKRVQTEIKGAHGVLVTAVSREVFTLAVNMLRRHGTASFVGLPPGDFNLSIFDIVLNRKTIRGSIVGTRADLAESLAFAAEGKVSVRYALDTLENINHIFDKMRQGMIQGRIVMNINKSDKLYSYPKYLISSYQLSDDKTITIRPIRADDINNLQEFIRNLSAQNKHSQFMSNFKELSVNMLNRLTQIDYDNEMVLIATYQQNGKEINIAMARYVANADRETCESIVVVADAWQNKHIGRQLMNILIEIAKSKGFKAMTGVILASNLEMIELASHLGFTISNSDDPTVKIVIKMLI